MDGEWIEVVGKQSKAKRTKVNKANHAGHSTAKTLDHVETYHDTFPSLTAAMKSFAISILGDFVVPQANLPFGERNGS